MLDPNVCREARLSNDRRFDGRFFVAVKSTGIYCRPICRVKTPKEENVHYYQTAIEASQQGYRPCLRCRPDSAPHSFAWKGVDTTLERAIHLLINSNDSINSMQEIATRLGITDRYLRKLFDTHLGISPKQFTLFHQCLFAKKLLHETSLPITQIAFNSGFKSVRRFNDCFKKTLQLTPSQVRRTRSIKSKYLSLEFSYRPPYNWEYIRTFLARRAIPRMEWVDESSYGRTFDFKGVKGCFTATHIAEKCLFDVKLELTEIKELRAIVKNIRRILDLDVDTTTVEKRLLSYFKDSNEYLSGMRLPGIWDAYEAGIRAVLGQQISVTAARNHTINIVNTLGHCEQNYHYFPSPKTLAHSALSFLKMPARRKDTLRQLALHCDTHSYGDIEALDKWLEIKGIGPWTVDYAKMRGLSDPDIYLGSDLWIKKKGGSLKDVESVSPWRSYLTLQLWNKI